MKKFIAILLIVSCCCGCNPQPPGKRVKYSLGAITTYGPCVDPAKAIATAEKAKNDNTLPGYKAEAVPCE